MSLTGAWDLTVHTYMGDQNSQHVYEVEGNTLKGYVMDRGTGNKAEISDGTVDGNDFSYKFTLKIPIGEMEFTMKGSLQEDGTIKGMSANAMGEFEFDAKKE